MWSDPSDCSLIKIWLREVRMEMCTIISRNLDKHGRIVIGRSLLTLFEFPDFRIGIIEPILSGEGKHQTLKIY